MDRFLGLLHKIITLRGLWWFIIVNSSGGTNQTIIWLIDKFSLFEINRYLINLYQTIQIIQKGDFWGINRRFLAIWDNFEIQFFGFFLWN
jgi:hypothetical protein